MRTAQIERTATWHRSDRRSTPRYSSSGWRRHARCASPFHVGSIRFLPASWHPLSLLSAPQAQPPRHHDRPRPQGQNCPLTSAYRPTYIHNSNFTENARLREEFAAPHCTGSTAPHRTVRRAAPTPPEGNPRPSASRCLYTAGAEPQARMARPFFPRTTCIPSSNRPRSPRHRLTIRISFVSRSRPGCAAARSLQITLPSVP